MSEGSELISGLEVDARLRLGSLELDVQLGVRPDEVVAVVGPNGAGKTTLLRCIAGLTPLDAGRLVVDGTPLDAPDDDVFVPPERRSIGVVFQDHLLFESMSALDNVAFGLRARGTPKHQARERAARWLERVGLADHAGHRPGALSGGQSQRVALGRALVTDPRVLLLDEPLAALDAGARAAMRRELRRHLTSFPGMRLLVTHDPVDAHALADRVVVLEGGRVVQQGRLADVTAHPRSRYVADLVGMSVVSGRLHGDVLTTDEGATIVVGSSDGTNGAASVVIRPRVVSLHRRQPEGSTRNVWPLRVVDIHRRQDRGHVALDGVLQVVAEVTPAALDELELRVGDEVWAAVKATELAAVTD